jgi:lysophospholipase L1-like esterase
MSTKAMSNQPSKTKKRLAQLLTVLIALSIGLIVSEFACRWMFNRIGMHYGLEMWKYARLIKRQNDNPNIGHEHEPNTRATLMGVDVNINSRRLRDREFSTTKPEGVYRILLLGDSMTFGWGARLEDTYAKVLERMLNENPPGNHQQFEVINTGVGNYNTVQEVAYFKQYGLQYDPDMVILGYYINDAEPIPRPKGGWLARHSYLYVATSSFLGSLGRKMSSGPSWLSYYQNLYREDQPAWQACQQAIRDLIETCHETQIALTVLLVPELHSPQDYPFLEIQKKIETIAKEGHIPTVDPRPQLPDVTPLDLWVSPGDAHPNAIAHRVFAEALFAHVTRELGAVDE